jgi:cytoskeletal protein RodZ
MTVEQPAAGNDTCAQCGSALAADQRYCLNCGLRRGEARVDYQTQMMHTGQPAVAGGPAPAPSGSQWSPVMAIGAIALLGVFLLLGVLIGKDDNNTTQTVAAQAAPTTTSAATATTDTTAAAPAKDKGGNKAAAAGTTPGTGNVVQGGSGNTEGIQTADTNKSVVENAKNGPDVVATGGAPEKLDPGGQAGGGSSATCIGC